MLAVLVQGVSGSRKSVKLLTWASRARVMPKIRLANRVAIGWGPSFYDAPLIELRDFKANHARHMDWDMRYKGRRMWLRPSIKSAAEVSGDDAFKEGGNIQRPPGWPFFAKIRSIRG